MYGSLHPNAIQVMLRESGLKRTGTFVDVGSGVGQIVLQAAATYGCRAAGVEVLDIRHDTGVALRDKFIGILNRKRPGFDITVAGSGGRAPVFGWIMATPEPAAAAAAAAGAAASAAAACGSAGAAAAVGGNAVKRAAAAAWSVSTTGDEEDTEMSGTTTPESSTSGSGSVAVAAPATPLIARARVLTAAMASSRTLSAPVPPPAAGAAAVAAAAAAGAVAAGGPRTRFLEARSFADLVELRNGCFSQHTDLLLEKPATADDDDNLVIFINNYGEWWAAGRGDPLSVGGRSGASTETLEQKAIAILRHCRPGTKLITLASLADAPISWAVGWPPELPPDAAAAAAVRGGGTRIDDDAGARGALVQLPNWQEYSGGRRTPPLRTYEAPRNSVSWGGNLECGALTFFQYTIGAPWVCVCKTHGGVNDSTNTTCAYCDTAQPTAGRLCGRRAPPRLGGGSGGSGGRRS
ncbi:unnamed protein product [Phaeothamnion confervicola]